MQVQVKPPMAVTNAVSWRSEGIKYKKNEVSLLLQTIQVASKVWWPLHTYCQSQQRTAPSHVPPQ